jgi:hypothetical protein
MHAWLPAILPDRIPAIRAAEGAQATVLLSAQDLAVILSEVQSMRAEFEQHSA